MDDQLRGSQLLNRSSALLQRFKQIKPMMESTIDDDSKGWSFKHIKLVDTIEPPFMRASASNGMTTQSVSPSNL
jgi:hypothetical protein